MGKATAAVSIGKDQMTGAGAISGGMQILATGRVAGREAEE